MIVTIPDMKIPQTVALSTVFFIETLLLNCYTKTVLQIQEMGLWL